MRGAISDFNMALSIDDQSGEDLAEAQKLGFKEPVGEKQKEK
jgi:hypothetical protein